MKIIPIEQFFVLVAILLHWFNYKLYVSFISLNYLMITVKLTAIPGKTKAIISEVISALLILVLMYAAISKIIDHTTFLYYLQNSPLLASHSPIVSWTVPFVEIIISLLLFFPKLRRSGLLYSGLLMCVFTFYILYMIVFIPHLPCSCGGVLKSMGWKQHLIFNICVTLLAFFAWLLSDMNKDFIAINR